MTSIKVSIIRVFDDKYYPGWAECILKDLFNKKHKFIDKVPIFTELSLDSQSIVPQDGTIRCKVLERWIEDGRNLIKVSTKEPDDVETCDGITEFILLENQVLQ